MLYVCKELFYDLNYVSNGMGARVRKADGMDQCQVRIPKGLLDKIDELVNQKKICIQS